MDSTDHDLRQTCYDVAGQPMEAKAFYKRYPARLVVRRVELLGLLIVTEFVGIDHNVDGKRNTPWIYETTVTVRLEVVSSLWAGGLKRAVLAHYWTVLRALLGGALWWRLKAKENDDEQDE